MIDILLNAVKFLVSPNFRSSASAIVELVRNAPEWQKMICQLEIKIPRTHSEQAYLFRDLAVAKMSSLHYQADSITAFRISFLELANNAFEHGCNKDTDKICLTIDLSDTYTALSIMNPKGAQFNFEHCLAESRTRSDSKRRGHGLELVSQLADTFNQIENRGIKAVFYRFRVEFSINQIGDLTILKLINEHCIDNPSLQRRLLEAATPHFSNDLILDFSVLDALPTSLRTAILDLKDLYASSSRKVVALMPGTAGSELKLVNTVIAASWRDVFSKLGRPQDQKRVKAIISRLSGGED